MKILGMENRIEVNETPLKHFIHNYRNKTGGLTLRSDKQNLGASLASAILLLKTFAR